MRKNKFNKELRDKLWKRGISVPGDELIKKDAYGNILHYHDYGNKDSLYGWVVDHIIPYSFLKKNSIPDNNIGNYQIIKMSTNLNESNNMLYKQFIYTNDFINYSKHIFNININNGIGTFIPSFSQFVDSKNIDIDNTKLMKYEKKINGFNIIGKYKYIGDTDFKSDELLIFLNEVLGTNSFKYIEKDYWLTSTNILFKLIYDKYDIEDIKTHFIKYSKINHNIREFIIYDIKNKKMMKHIIYDY